MISYKTCDLAVDEIDLQDQTYKISTERNPEQLVASIQDLGLITPPILLRKPSAHTVVSGFQRIKACRSLEISHLPVRVLPHDTSPLLCAKTAIAENSLQRNLNIIEKSRALNLLDRFSESLPQMEDILPALGLPRNPSLIRKVKKIQNLPDPIQEGVLSGRVSMDMALKIGRLEPGAGSALFEIFSDLSLGHGKQRELWNNIMEISHRDNVSPAILLASDEIQLILRNQDLDRRQKTNYLRDSIKKQRFPHLYAAEKEFADKVKNLKLGPGISLKPADYFEGSASSLIIFFRNSHELRAHLSSLNYKLKDVEGEL